MFNPNRYRFARQRAFDHQLTNYCRAQAPVPMRGKNRDIQNSNPFGAVNINSPDWFCVLKNYLVIGGGKLGVIIRVLGVKLHSEESFALLVAPGHQRHFLCSRTGINLAQKCFICF